jgi:RES domain-containing protein
MERSHDPAVDAVDALVRTTGPLSALRVEELVSADGNRWSHEGEPTVYLASSDAVVLAEFGRHLDDDGAAVGFWSLRLRASAVVDLRGLRTTDPARLLDPGWCAQIARRWRSEPGCEGMLVPSVAFLDRADAWNVVLFVERLRRPLSETLTDARPTATWRAANASTEG